MSVARSQDHITIIHSKNSPVVVLPGSRVDINVTTIRMVDGLIEIDVFATNELCALLTAGHLSQRFHLIYGEDAFMGCSIKERSGPCRIMYLTRETAAALADPSSHP